MRILKLTTLALALAGALPTQAADPATIKQVVTVFKDGIGYDSARLLALVKGRVGIN